MNTLHKIFGGLIAVLALAAYTAVPAMAAESSDNHGIDVEVKNVKNIDVRPDNNSNEFDTFTWDGDDWDAGDDVANNEKTTNGAIDFTTTTTSDITGCTDEDTAVGSDSSSQAYFEIDFSRGTDDKNGGTYQSGIQSTDFLSVEDLTSATTATNRISTDCNSGSTDILTGANAGGGILKFKYRMQADARDGTVPAVNYNFKYTLEDA